MPPHAYCSYCGSSFDHETWPRTCPCGETTWSNPTPVAVLLVPVPGGLLGVRRGIEPGKGSLALPGGFIVTGETWQEAGAREVFEECNVVIDPEWIEDYGVKSPPSRHTILIFGKTPPLDELPPFIPNDEVLERVVLTAESVDEMVFPTHRGMVLRYFREIA